MRLNCDGGEFYYDGESIGDTFDFECSIAKVKISKLYLWFLLVLDFLESLCIISKQPFSSLLTKFTKIFFCSVNCPEFNHYTTKFWTYFTRDCQVLGCLWVKSFKPFSLKITHWTSLNRGSPISPQNPKYRGYVTYISKIRLLQLVLNRPGLNTSNPKLWSLSIRHPSCG